MMGNFLGPDGEQCLAAGDCVLHDAYGEAARAAPMLGAHAWTSVVSPLLSSFSTSGNPPLS